MSLDFFYEDTSSTIQYNENWSAKQDTTSNTTYHMASPGAICLIMTYYSPVLIVGFIKGLPGDEWTFEFTLGGGLPDTRTLISDGTGNHQLFYQTPRSSEGPTYSSDLRMKLISSPNITGLDEARSANLVGFMVSPLYATGSDNVFTYRVGNNATEVTYSPGWGHYSGSDHLFEGLYIPPSQGAATLMFDGIGVFPIVFYNYSYPFNITAYLDNKAIPSSNFTPRLAPDPLSRGIVQEWPLLQYSGLPFGLHNLTLVYSSSENDAIPGSEFAIGLEYFSVLSVPSTGQPSHSDPGLISAGGKGAIAGGVIFFVCLVLFCILFWRRRRPRHSRHRMEGATNSFKKNEPIAIVQVTNLFKGSLEHDHHPQTIHVLPSFRTKATKVQSGLADQDVGRKDENSHGGDAFKEKGSRIDKPQAYEDHGV
ncbi:hypothetical protein AMATHDRAFT_43964 [Amanita thiersii Skay4041]|uniref:Uncharacterized protein n=1 Tax=Amanita thiersii Skay4041 TaxID=703135 RepID=A0A2A9NDR5_9AGAR|nr:hypothetical protein AMATHDRAFT_43964 [Amanita thiersii Skay4041]